MVSICTGNIFFFSSHTYINLPRRIYVTPLLSHNKGHTTRQRVCVIWKRVCSWYYYRVDDETDTTLSHMCAYSTWRKKSTTLLDTCYSTWRNILNPEIERERLRVGWLWSNVNGRFVWSVLPEIPSSVLPEIPTSLIPTTKYHKPFPRSWVQCYLWIS